MTKEIESTGEQISERERAKTIKKGELTMNHIQLHKPDGTPTKIFLCGKCGRLWTDEEYSEKCCCCYSCGKPMENQRGGTRCDDCYRKQNAEVYRKRIEKAEKLEKWDGPVFDDTNSNGDEQDYYSNVGALIESYEDDGRELPEYVFTCATTPFAIDCDRILEWAEEDHAEDTFDRLSGIDELRAAVVAFNEANKCVVSWSPDYKQVVAVKH